MDTVARAIHHARHGSVGRRLPGLWNVVRPVWKVAAIAATRGRGFNHLVNGVDRFRISLRQMPNAAPIDWEPEQYIEVMSAIGEGDDVIDVGAFWGLFALGAARRVGASGRVVAIEPSPRQFSLLKSNVEANDLKAVIESVPEICAAESGHVIDFYADPEGSMVDSAVPNAERNVKAVSCRTTTIDELVARFELQPNVIKIDVEGFEDLVLTGAAATIRKYRPTVFLEFHPQELEVRGSSVATVLDILRDLSLSGVESLRAQSVPRGRLFKFESNRV